MQTGTCPPLSPSRPSKPSYPPTLIPAYPLPILFPCRLPPKQSKSAAAPPLLRLTRNPVRLHLNPGRAPRVVTPVVAPRGAHSSVPSCRRQSRQLAARGANRHPPQSVTVASGARGARGAEPLRAESHKSARASGLGPLTVHKQAGTSARQQAGWSCGTWFLRSSLVLGAADGPTPCSKFSLRRAGRRPLRPRRGRVAPGAARRVSA
jgi:hypothetical protein